MDEDGRKAAGKASAKALGDWLRGMQWRHLAHITHRLPVTRQQSRRAFAEWIAALRRSKNQGQSKLSWFAAFEKGANGREHIHALVHDPWTAADLRAEWRSGISEIEDYDLARGGAYYVAKVAADPEGDFDLSDELPPSCEETASYSAMQEATLARLTEKYEKGAQVRTTGAKKHFSTILDAKLLRALRIAAAEDETTIARITARALQRYLRKRAKDQAETEKARKRPSRRES